MIFEVIYVAPTSVVQNYKWMRWRSKRVKCIRFEFEVRFIPWLVLDGINFYDLFIRVWTARDGFVNHCCP